MTYQYSHHFYNAIMCSWKKVVLQYEKVVLQYNLIEHTGGSLEAINILIIHQNCRVCNTMTLQYLRQTSYWSLQHPLWLWSLGEPISTNCTRKVMTDMSRFIFHVAVAQSTISLNEILIHKLYKEVEDRHVAVPFPYRGCTVDLFTWGDCGSQMVAKMERILERWRRL